MPTLTHSVCKTNISPLSLLVCVALNYNLCSIETVSLQFLTLVLSRRATVREAEVQIDQRGTGHHLRRTGRLLNAVVTVIAAVVNRDDIHNDRHVIVDTSKIDFPPFLALLVKNRQNLLWESGNGGRDVYNNIMHAEQTSGLRFTTKAEYYDANAKRLTLQVLDDYDVNWWWHILKVRPWTWSCMLPLVFSHALVRPPAPRVYIHRCRHFTSLSA